MPDKIRIEVEGAMQTPDGAWRIESVHEIRYRYNGADQSRWYRIIYPGGTMNGLTIGGVAAILAENDIDMATLTEIPDNNA